MFSYLSHVMIIMYKVKVNVIIYSIPYSYLVAKAFNKTLDFSINVICPLQGFTKLLQCGLSRGERCGNVHGPFVGGTLQHQYDPKPCATDGIESRGGSTTSKSNRLFHLRRTI